VKGARPPPAGRGSAASQSAARGLRGLASKLPLVIPSRMGRSRRTRLGRNDPMPLWQWQEAVSPTPSPRRRPCSGSRRRPISASTTPRARRRARSNRALRPTGATRYRAAYLSHDLRAAPPPITARCSSSAAAVTRAIATAPAAPFGPLETGAARPRSRPRPSRSASLWSTRSPETSRRMSLPFCTAKASEGITAGRPSPRRRRR